MSKWKTEKENLKENDFVLIKEDLLPATEWLLGRIEKVLHEKDQNFRFAEIQTSNGIIKCPTKNYVYLKKIRMTRLKTFLSIHDLKDLIQTHISTALCIFLFFYFQINMLNKPPCQLCRRNHPLKYCIKFRNMTEQRTQKRMATA